MIDLEARQRTLIGWCFVCKQTGLAHVHTISAAQSKALDAAIFFGTNAPRSWPTPTTGQGRVRP